MKFNRRKFLKNMALGLPGLIFLDSYFYEPHNVSISKMSFKTSGAIGDKVLTIVQISDLHLQKINHYIKKVATHINNLKPKLLLITGDSIDRSDKMNILNDFLTLLNPNLKKLSILGNWENWANINMKSLHSTYAKHNCQLLVNESTIVSIEDRNLLITGLDDDVEGNPQIELALKNFKPQKNHLILHHSPAFVDKLFNKQYKLDFDSREEISKFSLSNFSPQLMLSGHTHGGQVTFFGFAPILPRGSGRYTRGWYKKNNIQLYVSRGIGTTNIPFRFMSKPEIVYLEWTLA